MTWEQVTKRLGSILGIPVDIVQMSRKKWRNVSGKKGSDESNSISILGNSVIDVSNTYLLLSEGQQNVTVMKISSGNLSESERKLVELQVELMLEMKTDASVNVLEEKLSELQNWINRQFQQGNIQQELPDHFSTFPQLYTRQIPILMVCELPGSDQIHYEEANRLFASFFEEQEIMLLPLQEREWLILAPERIMSASSQEMNDEEPMEELLSSVCLGLHEMVATEWIGECHFSIYPPIVPAKHLMKAISMMREAVQLGKKYRMTSNVHLPWRLHLEKMLELIPQKDKNELLEQILGQVDHVLDVEMLSTLEHFFELGCNVSDTAKKLYIHRNTLLYRLDKFKQETGLDVRMFNDAVLVKIAMLLYKVTKRQ